VRLLFAFISQFSIIFFLSLKGYAQEFNVINIGTDKGLITTEVHDIDQDKDGFMWFATDIGVIKYDGNNFNYYTSKNGLSHTIVFDIFIDINERMWFSTYKGGICYFDNGSIKDYTYNKTLLGLIDSISKFDSHINDFLFEDDELWFTLTRNRGLYKIDKAGNIVFFDFSDQKATIFSKNTFLGDLTGFTYDGPIDSNNINSNDSVFNFYFLPEFHNEKKFKTVKDGDFISINNEILKIENTKSISKIIGPTIFAIKIDHQNNLWIGTKNEGLLFYPKGNFINQKPPNYLKGMTVTDIFQDKQDNIWIATLEKGVFVIKSLNVLTYKLIDKNINSRVCKLEANDYGILFGTVDGSVYSIVNDTISLLYNINSTDIKDILVINDHEALINGEKINFIKKNDLKYHESIYKDLKVFAANNDVIAGGYYGFLIFEKDKIIYDSKAESHSINEEKIKELCYVKDTLWILTTSGIYHFFGNEIESTEFPGIEATEITALSNFKDSVLVICTMNDGIYLKNSTSIKHFSTNQGLNSNICYSLFCSDNIIYVGTNKGLNVIEFNKGMPMVKYIDKTNYLSSNMIYGIGLSNNHLVLATDKEIDIVDQNKIIPFTFNSTYISPILVNNKKYYSSNYFYNLKASENNIQINFITPFYGEDNQIKYRYKLSGTDDKWKVTTNTSIQFPNLSPGEYRFTVQPFYNNIYGESRFIDLNIHPYFTQTWWFRSVIFLIVIWIVYLIYSSKLIKKELEKDLILSKQQALRSQMNPHFIFNSLNSIQNFILKNQQDLSVRYLSRFSKLIRNILDNSDKLFVPISEDVEALTHYIELEKTRFKNKFEYSFDIDPLLDTNLYCIPPLLIQPCVENSIWHGLMHKEAEGKIIISYQLNKDKITCAVEDDGVGRKKANELGSNDTYESKGMSITSDRISILAKTNKIDIKFEIIDLYDENNVPCGTKIEFNLPLIKDA